jgi:hypothetical protein
MMADDLAPANAALEFLTELYDRTTTGHLHIFALDHNTGDRHIEWVHVDQLDRLTGAAHDLTDTCSIWYGVAPRHRDLGPTRRGGANDCTTIPALWADIDIAGPGHAAEDLPTDRAAAWALIRSFPLRPTVVVDTGGGLQPYWVLDEPATAAEAIDLLPRWGATWAELGRRQGVHVDNVFDLARIMRLPGTYNRKPDHDVAPLVTIAHEDWGTVYSLAEIDEHTIELYEPPAPAGQAAERRVPYIGPERPGDAFNAATDPGQLLERAGFHFDHQAGGDRHYRAPHRPDRRESTGATVYADGHTTIWSETFAAGHPGLTVKRPYDPFGLYAAIWHRGDWTAATTELGRLGFGQAAVSLASLIAKIPAPTGATSGFPASDEDDDDWSRIDLVDLLDARRNGTAERILPTILAVHHATALPKANLP